jgi:probable rRNA maturation factor
MDTDLIEADIILCGAVLAREADEQNKSILAHAAHLVVHGVLHAQGFDHIDDDEAEMMESLETQILARLGFDNPYMDSDSTRLEI